MSDFTLPIDNAQRAEKVSKYKRQIDAAVSLAKQNETVREPAEEVTVGARQANRMAFELMLAGEYTEDEWKGIIEPLARYLTTRPYERSTVTLEVLAEQKETVFN